MAIASKKATMMPFIMLLFTAFCCYCFFSSLERDMSLVKSIFIKGEVKHYKELIPETYDGDNNFVPEHYKTNYYFEPNRTNSETLSSMVELAMIIIALGVPVLVFYIVRDRIN
jgi:hypothetical protein